MDQSASVGISFQEFEQLQQQIVTLRTENYDLQTKNGKYAKELYELKPKVEALSSENVRLNKVVNKDKRAKEIEQLMIENERLQQKLQSQESDFQLQCQTLMTEITQLSTDKDLLSQSVEQYRHVINATLSPDEIDTMRSELLSLREECSRLRTNNHPVLVNETDAPENSELEHRTKSTNSDRGVVSNDAAFFDLKMQIASMQNERKLLLAELDGSKKSAVAMQAKLNETVSDMEEKRLAYEKLFAEKDALVSQCSCLEEKCSSFQVFQKKYEEAEIELARLTGELKDVDARHSVEIAALLGEVKNLKDECVRFASENQEMKKQLSGLTEVADNSKATAESATNELSVERIKVAEMLNHIEAQTFSLRDLEDKLEEASKQIDSFITSTEDMEQQIAELTSQVDSSKQECEDLKNELTSKQLEIDRLTTDVCDAVALSEKYLKDLETEQGHLSSLQNELASVSSRKDSELEELRKEIQFIRRDAEEVIVTNRKKDAAQVKDLRRQLKTEKRRVEQLQERLEQLFQQNSSSLNPSESSPHHLSGLSSEMDRKSDHDNFDTSSVSSFSLSMKNAFGTVFGNSSGSAPLSKTGGNMHSSTPHTHTLSLGVVPHAINDTVSDLSSQIYKLNLENDRLKEKINYLETTSAAMADDVIKKQQVIDHYLMGDRQSTTVSPSVSINAGFSNTGGSAKFGKGESPAPVQAFKSLFEKVSSASHNNQQNHNNTEETKRLKRAMEEILTKNMSLEADLQRLSEENARLRTERTSETSLASTLTH